MVSNNDSSERDSAPLRRPRSRHRGVRGSVTGPFLPRVTDRIDTFATVVQDAASLLRSLRPHELRGVRIEPALLPGPSTESVARWAVDRKHRRILIFRIPIERFGHYARSDAAHRRSHIEAAVVRAVAEYLDVDPWELAGDRFPWHD